MSAGVEGSLVSSKKMLSKLFTEILSSHPQRRIVARAKLEALKSLDEFGTHSIEVIIDPNEQLAIRQLASKHLKKYAYTHLCSWGGQREPRKITWKSTENIKKLLLRGLGGSDSKMRRAVADVISVIAYWDYPRNWPGLRDVLINYLSEENKFTVDGVLQVFCKCSRFGGRSLMMILDPVVLQEMYRIILSENQYSMGIRSQAVNIFADIVKECGTSFIQEYLQPRISIFCKKFVEYLSEQNDTSSDSFGLKTNIVKAITQLTHKLPKCISNFFPQMLSLIWQTLIDSAKVYRADTISGKRDIEDEDSDFDGEILNNSNDLVQAILHFISALMSKPSESDLQDSEYDLSDYQWFYLQDSLSPEVLHHLILFMTITDEKIEQWTNDPIMFFKVEEKWDYPDDLRTEIIEIVMMDSILNIPTRAAANALVVAILKQVETEDTIRVTRNSGVSQIWWKSHEAFLLAFCLAKDVIVRKQNEKTLHFDIVSFLENVVLVDLDNSESHPLLIGRCLCLGGLYAEQMPLEMASRFLEATINGLRNQSVCTKICAAIAARHWFQFTSIEGTQRYKETLRSYLPDLFQELFNFGSQAKSREIFELVIENLGHLASFDKAFITSALSKIYTLIVTAYPQMHHAHKTRSVCSLFFEEFTLNPKYVGPLQSFMVPKLIESFDFDVVAILVRNSPQPLSNLLIESLFPALCQYLLREACKNYGGIHTNGGLVICIYLSVAAQQVINCRDEQGKTGLQYILQIAAKLLKPQFRDSEALVACEIATLLITNAGSMLRVDEPDMQRLLVAVLGKMKTTDRQSVLHRNLLMIWAHLINIQIDHVLNFLSTIDGSTGHSSRVIQEHALAFVIFSGFCEEYTFFEGDEHKIVSQALCKIIEHGMTRHKSLLHNIDIEGTENGETTTIPLLVQICKLFTSVFSKKVEELEEAQEIEEE